MVECKACGSEMRSTFTKDQIKEMLGDQENPFFELELKSSFTCDNCGVERKLSRMEIIKEFMTSRKKSGKSSSEITEEIIDKAKEFKK